jgi:DNA-binding NarL/FixJ family response regulator
MSSMLALDPSRQAPVDQTAPAKASKAAGPIAVLVADDDSFTRRMVSEQLAAEDVRVVGEARNGNEAVAMALELRPDVVVMNLVMPGCDGITAAGRIALQAPEIKVMILSLATDPEAVVLALRSGAVGFLDKEIEMDALLRTVRGVFRGEAALDRITTRTLIQEFQAISMRAEIGGVPRTVTAGSTLASVASQIAALLRRRTQEKERRP